MTAMKGGAMLEFAVLGLLQESPMHGYELRKRLSGLLGPFRALSYGSLYPALKKMKLSGYIDESFREDNLVARRAKKVYHITEPGVLSFKEHLNDVQAINTNEEGFGVHLAFFSLTPAKVRIRILEGRRNQVEQRKSQIQTLLTLKPMAKESYSRGLKHLELEAAEREVVWLNNLIASEYSTLSKGSEGVFNHDP